MALNLVLIGPGDNARPAAADRIHCHAAAQARRHERCGFPVRVTGVPGRRGHGHRARYRQPPQAEHGAVTGSEDRDRRCPRHHRDPAQPGKRTVQAAETAQVAGTCRQHVPVVHPGPRPALQPWALIGAGAVVEAKLSSWESYLARFGFCFWPRPLTSSWRSTRYSGPADPDASGQVPDRDRHPHRQGDHFGGLDPGLLAHRQQPLLDPHLKHLQISMELGLGRRGEQTGRQ
jgi:hypothetical protein